MKDPKANSTIAQANELFEYAEQELSRPAEDVVGYLVCHNAYKSIDKYLSAFLMENGHHLNASTSIENMLNECRLIDPRFKELNLDVLYKTKVKEDVYMDMTTVRHYMSMASQTRKLISNSN